ncbi:MAG: hypothetical protein ACFCD0_13315 [Gemmataceae bacterium]
MSSTFYLLESRNACGEVFAKLLERMFPGLNWAEQNLSDLSETLAELAESRQNVHVVYREDLPEEDLPNTLQALYGAEQGDTIIEIPSDGVDGTIVSQQITITFPEHVRTE